MTLDNVKENEMQLAYICHLRKESEKTVEHLLPHYKKSQILWDFNTWPLQKSMGDD